MTIYFIILEIQKSVIQLITESPHQQYLQMPIILYGSYLSVNFLGITHCYLTKEYSGIS